MLGLSILFDFIWLLRADWNKLIGLLVIINMMVKVVHIFLCHVVRLMVVLTFTFYLLWTTGPYLLCGAHGFEIPRGQIWRSRRERRGWLAAVSCGKYRYDILSSKPSYTHAELSSPRFYLPCF